MAFFITSFPLSSEKKPSSKPEKPKFLAKSTTSLLEVMASSSSSGGFS